MSNSKIRRKKQQQRNECRAYCVFATVYAFYLQYVNSIGIGNGMPVSIKSNGKNERN